MSIYVARDFTGLKSREAQRCTDYSAKFIELHNKNYPRSAFYCTLQQVCCYDENKKFASVLGASNKLIDTECAGEWIGNWVGV